ncbi:unnamed protein product [Lathyrus sativus]|nr:unnamed protein product [Lathyrus sativus]
MDVHSFPISWLNRFNLKPFVVYSRGDISPNLWCLCDKSIDPDIVDIGDLFISFTFKSNEQTIGITTVYASTCYIARRNLWTGLHRVLNHTSLPWCFIGDFNTINGAHEYNGYYSPARGPMEEFNDSTNFNCLVHIQTSDAKFTWSNGRYGARHTHKRLDRALCN